jgi:hypothetical protein
MADVKDFRLALKIEVGKCDWCQVPKSPEHLDADEIARGPVRSQALDQPYALLVMCRRDHDLAQNWSRARRLALLKIRRPLLFDLEAFHKLTDRRFPDLADVLREEERLRAELS